MKNTAQWTPSKFLLVNGRLVPSRNPLHLGIASRLIAKYIADVYNDILPAHARGRLLDLGCGRVPLYEAYKGYITDCTCIDWGLSLHDSIHLDFQCDLNSPLPCCNAEFDTILLSDVLEHIATPDNLWREMSRVLAPRGKIILNVPFYYGIHEAPHDYYRFTEFALRRFAEQARLSVVTLQPFGGTPAIITDLFAKTAIRLPLLGKPLALFAQWITYGLTRMGPLKKISDATKVRFPLGYFLVAVKA